ncbi:MAG: asparagine synthase-related protein [Alphaproteobacteria bacterium]
MLTGNATLCGAVDFRESRASLRKVASGGLWPEVINHQRADGLVQVAVNGYLVVDDVLLLGDNEKDRRLILEKVALQEPEAFLRSIQNGNYTIAIHDAPNRRTRLISSWGGFLPLYLHADSNRLAFADSLAALQELAGKSFAPDEVGLAELYWLGYQVGDRTALEGVSHIPPGVIVDIDWRSGQRSVKTWTRSGFEGSSLSAVSKDDPVEAFLALLRQACRRLKRPERRYGIKLSGGMDSRLLLACWEDKNIAAYTFGAARSVETKIARRLAQSFGISFNEAVIEGDFFSEIQRPLIARFGIAEYFHAALLPAFVQTGCDLTLDGLLGDVLFGGLTLKRSGGLAAKVMNAFGLVPPPLEMKSHDEMAEYIFSQTAVGDGTFRVLHPDIHDKLDRQRDEVKHDIAAYLRSLPQERGFIGLYTDYILGNRSRRYISLQGASCRPEVETLYPYIDRDILQFAAGLDAATVAGKRFYMRVYRSIASATNDLVSVNSLMPAGWPEGVQFIGRVARFGIETVGYRLALLSGGRIDIGRINCNQWPRWIAFDQPLRSAARAFMDSTGMLEGAKYDTALRTSHRDHHIRGTRLMLTLSYCGLTGHAHAT